MRAMRPVSARPMFTHVVPESTDLYTPSPTRSASRIAPPSPAQTIGGWEGATASGPIAWTGMLSDTGRNVAPLSIDFHTPPDAAPRYTTRASPGTPVTAEICQPSRGHIHWNRNGSGGGGGAGGRAAVGVPVAPRCWAPSALAATRRI